MDLTLPLIGVLGVVGYNLNKPQNSREYTNKRVKIPTSELGSGKTIYEAREFARIQNEEKQAYEKMRKNNAIVSFNNKSDALVSANIKTAKIKEISEPNLNNYKGPDIFPDTQKIFTGPMFSVDRYFIPQENVKSFNSKETFDNTSSLTGEKTDFSHQNMQPFFGGKVKNADTSNTLGRYTGRDYAEPKKEVEAKMNGPVNNVYGNVLFTDSIQQDRFISSTFQTALLPFEQVRVQPIPGEHNRGRQIGVDELRGAVNPKMVLEGRFTPGKTIAQRPMYGEVPETRYETSYELGPSRQFKTTGEDQGTYFQDTEQYRQTRKDITAETTFNQNGGIDYKMSDLIRPGREDNGRNTVVQMDKRGNWKGDWVRSRKAVAIDSNDIPTAENLNLRKQERQEGNRQNMGNLSNKLSGTRSRFEDNLKTTNKELSLYTYKGGSNGNSIKKPEDRQAYYKNETKTKATMHYTPGGKKSNAPGVGVQDFNFESKRRAHPEGYVPSAGIRVPKTNELGDVTIGKFTGGEKDLSSRLTQKLQDRSYDRLMGEFGNDSLKR